MLLDYVDVLPKAVRIHREVVIGVGGNGVAERDRQIEVGRRDSEVLGDVLAPPT